MSVSRHEEMRTNFKRTADSKQTPQNSQNPAAAGLDFAASGTSGTIPSHSPLIKSTQLAGGAATTKAQKNTTINPNSQTSNSQQQPVSV